jgi:hypothetical protein
MAWRGKAGERPPRDGPGPRLYLAALAAALLVVLLMLPSMSGGVDIGLGTAYDLDQGVADYGEEDVRFTITCIAPTRIDFHDLQVEIVLLSDGRVVSVATSNESVSAEDPVIPKLRVFPNVTLPHQGEAKEGMGFILTLTYKGRLGAQYVTYSIPWDV